MSFWKTKDFKELQKAWYDELKSEGFFDAEEMVDGEMVLKTKQLRIDRIGRIGMECREAYYRMLSEKINQAVFLREVDRLVLTWYAEGHLIEEIVRRLREVGLSRNRWSVRVIIRKHEMAWGIKSYTKKQLRNYR